MSKSKHPRWLYPVSSIIVYVGIVGVFGWHFFTHLFLDRLPAQKCPTAVAPTTVTISATGWDEDPVRVQRCSIVTIKNNDHQARKPAIGKHEHHLIYPTFQEQKVEPGATMSFQASVPGEFQLHDHVDDVFETTIIIS